MHNVIASTNYNEFQIEAEMNGCATATYTHAGGVTYTVNAAPPILLGGQSITVLLYVEDCAPIEIVNYSTNNGNISKSTIVNIINSCHPESEEMYYTIKVQVIFNDRFGDSCNNFFGFTVSI